MKKILYFVLIIAELFAASMLMISLCDGSLYIPPAVSVVAIAGLLIWQLVRYVKVAELAVKRKLLRNIEFIMLVPFVVFRYLCCYRDFIYYRIFLKRSN